MPEKVHFHLAYIGKGKFQLTITGMRRLSEPIIEHMTTKQLRKSVRQMKRGSSEIRFAKACIDDESGVPLDMLKDYFEEVLRSHENAVASGVDVDREIEELRMNIDPVDGSGSWQS